MPDFEVLSFELIKLDLDFECVGSGMGKYVYFNIASQGMGGGGGPMLPTSML